MPRSTLIRHLTVFVYHLESVGIPGRPYHAICVQASKAMSRVLEDTLSPHVSSPGLSQASQQLGIVPRPSIQDTSIPSTEDPTTSGADRSSDIGLFDWVDQIDWTGATGEWGAF
jgi:hypothetical protein